MPTAPKKTPLMLDTAAIDNLAEQALRLSQAPGLAVAVVLGEETYAQGYGVRSLADGEKVTPDTLFALASVSKSFTTTALAILADRGKLVWDDPVRKHLPQFRLADPLADASVTLRDLVCHRTGMPRHDMLWFLSPNDRAEVIRRFGYAKGSAPLRTLYQYNNICFSAAGEAAARASGHASYEVLMREVLLDPLGMTRTNLSVSQTEADPDHATPHREPVFSRAPMPWRDLENIAPAGGLNSSAREMLAYIKFHLWNGCSTHGTRLLSEDALRETHTPQIIIRPTDESRRKYPETVTTAYALGWSVRDYRGGHRLVSHSGAIGGFRSHLALLPEQQAGVLVLVNMPTTAPEMLANALLDSLAALLPKDWLALIQSEEKRAQKEKKAKEAEKRKSRVRGTNPTLPLKAYTGEYEDAAYGTATVARNGKTLSLVWSGFTATLAHRHYDSFTTQTDEPSFADNDVQFVLGADGSVSALKLFDVSFGRKNAPKP